MSTAMQAGGQQGRDQVRALMQALQPQIAAVLPKHLTPERMVQIVAVEAARNPKLRECTPTTLASCVMLASELGLEPSGPLGHAYLIPRRNRGQMECTLLLGYKGMCELARRSGQIARISADVVYRSEVEAGAFSATREPPEIHHAWTPGLVREDGAIVAAYAVAVLSDGSRVQVLLDRDQIEARRKRAQSRDDGPWGTDYPAMARKSALRALLTGGLVPLSAEVAARIEADDPAEPEPGPVVTQAPKPSNALADALGLLEPPAEAPVDTTAVEP